MVASRQEIQSRLLAFADDQTLPAAAGELFAALGYASTRRLPYASAEAFFGQYDPAGKVAPDYRGVDGPVLFQQLTSEEIAANSGDQLLLSRTDGHAPDLRQIDSYLFLALDLPPGAPLTRGDLAERARAVNALFPQPVLTLFRQGSHISVAITYRRPHKRENSRDVIDRKVTIIRDISCRSPHPGHVSILEDFSLPALARARQRDIRSFNDLDDA